jgi:hypothetical protein
MGEAKRVGALAKAAADIKSQNGMPSCANVPTGTYFELLDWAVYHGGLQDSLRAFKDQIVGLFEDLSRLKSDLKCGICDCLHFVAHYRPDFWDPKSFARILSALDRCAKSDWPAYLDRIFGDFLLFIEPAKGEQQLIILKTSMMQRGLKAYMGAANSFGGPICRLAKGLITDAGCSQIISDIALRSELFQEQYEKRNTSYLELVGALVRQGRPSVETFLKNKCVVTVTSKLTKQLQHLPSRFDPMIEDLDLLLIFWKAVLQSPSSFLWDPQKQFKRFWLDQINVLNLLYGAVLQSNITVAFAEKGIVFLDAILNGHPDLLPYGMKLLNDQDDDFYLRLHRDVRKRFAEFAIGVLQKQPERIELAVRDLARLQQKGLLDPEIWVVYSRHLEQCDAHLRFPDLFDLFDHFFSAAEDLSAFNCWSFAVKISTDRGELRTKWTEKCIALVQQTFPLILAGAVTSLDTKLKYAQSFLQATNSTVPSDPQIVAALSSLGESSPDLAQTLSSILAS